MLSSCCLCASQPPWCRSRYASNPHHTTQTTTARPTHLPPIFTGSVNVVKGARVNQYTQGRARAEQGTAESGILNYGVANGVVGPFTFKGALPNSIYSETDHKVSKAERGVVL